MRKFWIQFHRISGLILLVPLLLQSISGSIIVFDHAIDEWLNPSLIVTHLPKEKLAALPLIRAATINALPDIDYIKSLRAPRNQHAAYTAFVQMKKTSPLYAKKMEIMIHPYTAEVLSIREWGSYFTSFIYLFHYTFLLGHNAELTLGFLAILMLVNVFVGIYYGWPRSTKAWKWLVAKNQKITPTVGRLRRAHMLAGLISLPVFTVVIISGISLIFPNQTKWLLDRPAKLNPPIQQQNNPSVDEDLWLKSAKNYWPDKQWQRINFPTQQRPAVEIRLTDASDPRKTSGSNMLWIDPYTNEVIAQQSYQPLTVRQKTAFWLFPLHNGEAFGLTGRIIIFISGLLTTLLSIAGGWLWYKRKFRPQRNQQQQKTMKLNLKEP
ncbi:hypothetical protein LCGC14_0998280 [marine sediment metagenome]|uniref:PepSY domain-containing protein n=1 Tax=marine sediment metagenome TaxID=412755 RepID=A0A0F9N3R5_9ZZZZ|nr:PepSY domain-containing protein [Methylophaga sp.]HEC59129.1 PepSY domain-containing protein [Methylophaga sp.]